MNLSNTTHPDDSLNVFVLTSSVPQASSRISYSSIISACHLLLKDFEHSHSELVYTHSYEDNRKMPIKLWNGSGIQIGSQVMRLGCRKKDLIIVFKNKAKPEPIEVERTEQEISKIIRKFNQECVIAFVQLNDKNSMFQNQQTSESPIVVNGIQMNVWPVTGKDNEQFYIRIDKQWQSSTTSGSSNMVTELAETMSTFYAQSHSGIESQVSKKFIRMSSIMPAKKTRYTPYATTHIEGLFDIFSPRRLNQSIRLKGVKSYYHRDG